MKYLFALFFLINIGSAVSFAQTVFRGKVLDSKTKEPIAGATISITDQGIGVLSKESGSFAYTKYNKVVDVSSILTVSADGYESITLDKDDIRVLFTNSNTFYLKKSTKTQSSTINKLKVYWDLSIGLPSERFEEVKDVMTQFIENSAIKKIEIIAFNNKLQTKDQFSYGRDSFIKSLENIQLNTTEGFSNYDLINDKDADAVLVVSNGLPVFGEPNLSGSNPLYPVLVGKEQNTAYFKEILQFTKGAFLENYETQLTSQENIPLVSGNVSSVAGPIQGAVISKKGSLQEIRTDFRGNFSIPASDGDVLIIEYLGMNSKQLLIEDIQKSVKVVLESSSYILDETIIKGSKDKQENRKIQSGFGKKSEKELGTQVGVITENEIGGEDLFLGDVLRGKFAGVSISGFGSDAVISIRNSDQQSLGSSSIGGDPIWVVDGAVLQLSLEEMNGIIDTRNIKSISVLKSLNATTLYGRIAANGAIVIKTKAGSYNEETVEEKIESLQVKGNDYTETLNMYDSATVENKYVTQLRSLSTADERFARYRKIERSIEPQASFYIDMALFFKDENLKYTREILQTVSKKAKDNVRIMRAVAFVYESIGQYQDARVIYEHIVSIAPEQAQSYRDLALIYKDVGQYNKALELYINMIGDQIRGVRFTGIKKYVVNELRHLIEKHKSQVEFERLPNELLTVGYRVDLRFTIQYTDSSAPFEFQFVDPDKKYFNWIHDFYQNEKELIDEKKEGYQMKEFEIDDASKGNWLVNLRFLGEDNPNSVATYVKYTVYKNYGSSKETKEIKVVKLKDFTKKMTLAVLDY
jgi:tetratricopeptide (TPR) repeat protein